MPRILDYAGQDVTRTVTVASIIANRGSGTPLTQVTTANAEEAAAAEEAKKKNLKVGVGLQRHHQAGYIETIKRLQDGAIGDIITTRVLERKYSLGPQARRS